MIAGKVTGRRLGKETYSVSQERFEKAQIILSRSELFIIIYLDIKNELWFQQKVRQKLDRQVLK
jgi:hypothetical protein